VVPHPTVVLRATLGAELACWLARSLLLFLLSDVTCVISKGEEP